MKRIKPDQINLIPLYEPLQMNFIFLSVMQGLKSADIYVNDEDNPTLSIVIEDNSIYFGGFDDDLMKYKETIHFFKNNIMKPFYLTKMYYLKLTFVSDLWKEMVTQELSDLKLIEATRYLYQHDLTNVQKTNHDLVKMIDDSILNSQYSYVGRLNDEITQMWGNKELFLLNGFGSVVIQNDATIAWCTAEYLSDGYCGIGIETIEDYQKQGYGALVATHFLNQCQQKRSVPHWDSWQKNVSSWKLAEKVGFKRIKEYQVIIIELK